MTGLVDLSPVHLATVEGILAEHVPDCEVRAFGSRAKWSARDASDLDLAIVGDGPLPSRTLTMLKEAFEESRLPMSVDVIDWNAIADSFRESIDLDTVVVQGAASPSGWREVAIGEIADIVGGGTPSTKDSKNFDGTIPWLTPKDLSGTHDRYIGRGERSLSQQGLDSSSAKLIPPGSVLLSTRAPIGYVALAKNQIATNQGFRSLVVRHSVVPEFLYYWLKLNTEELERHASGSTFRELSGSSLKEIRLRLPSLEEQHIIAEVLGALDNRIELNRRMSETLEEMARALFKSWFVDFDPVGAKAKGQPSGLPSTLDALFPASFEASELGKIPAGWEVKTLGELCHKPQYGYTQSAQDDPVGPKFLRITDINKGAWIVWDSVPYCRITSEDYEKYCLREGDVLIARMADPGHGCMVEEDQDAVFASYLIRFRPLDGRFGRFLQYWMQSDGYWQLVRERGAGTTRLSLNAKVLSGFPIVMPTPALLDAFGDTVGNLRSHVVTNTTGSSLLAGKRDALLPLLVSGELRVVNWGMAST